MSRIRKSLPLLVLAVLAGQLSASASDPLPAYRGSANLQLVAQIPGAGGTDLEFFSRELLQWKDASGAMNVVPDGQPPVTRHFAFVGNQTSGARIVDITNPETPFIVFHFTTCKPSQGDVQIAPGGMVATLAKQGGSCTLANGTSAPSGSIIIDMANVYAPRAVAVAKDARGAHNNTIHPSGKYLYISTSALAPSDGQMSRVPIFDISDPANPVKVKDFMIPVNGPHDIRFSHDGKRAYFAGVSAYHIVNTEDPKNPSIISTIVPPGGTIGHDTLVTRNKEFLFLGDEAGGGSTFPCPGGAIYAYDIRVEAAPILLGAVEAGGGPVVGRNLDEAPGPTRTGGCTSHVMELNPNGKSLTLGWYVLGARVFDFSSFYNADGSAKPAGQISAAWGRFGVGLVETGFMIPTDNASTWAAKQYAKVPGYIFSNDSTGFFVTKIKS